MKLPPMRATDHCDFVLCEFPLPDSRLQRTLFRTGGLGRQLERYAITRDGRLLRRASEGPPLGDGPYLTADVELPIHGDIDLFAKREDTGQDVCFVARFREGRVEWIKTLSEARPQRLHDLLLRACRSLPADYEPWGDQKREDPRAPGGWWPDCSAGCRHYLVLKDVGEEHISLDWGVCINARSHRFGLLTFEHQGCPAFEHELD